MKAGVLPRPDERIVTDDSVDAALSWLRDSAAHMGKAKERSVKAGHWLKHVEALEFKLSDAKSAEARKADARCSERFVEAITEDAVAAGEYERMRALREAAALVIETWRTQSSNFRSMKL
jgi:hypothetical protein